MLISAVTAAGLAAVVFFAARGKGGNSRAAPPGASPPPAAVADIVAAILAPPPLPASADPALLNLLCAPGGTATDRAAHLQTLDSMAAAIADTAACNFHHYQQTPAEFENEAGWRLAMIRSSKESGGCAVFSVQGRGRESRPCVMIAVFPSLPGS
ncbi:MAG: hypothetical protein K9N23_17550 [Akkermansiaceae bacterium]|nr:hypothetical protein [Akkermansiaceae bacterium]